MIYGTALRADSLSNVPLNNRTRVGILFTAHQSSAVNKIRITSPIRAGYTAGTGGDIRVTIQAQSDAFGGPEGYIAFNNTDPYAEAVMSPAVALQANHNYLIVIQNVADDPVNNWRSVDGFFVNQADPLDPPEFIYLQAPGQPWQLHSTNVPMWEVEYANGTFQGNGYIDCVNGAAVQLSTGVRQTITPIQNFTIGSGAIALRGLTAPGTVSLAGQTVPLSVPTITNGWSQFTFSPAITLTAGTNYFLVPTGSASAVPLQKGWATGPDGHTKIYTFGPGTWFADGNGQQLVNGVWTNWISEQGAPDPRLDMQFYLVTQ